MLTPREAAIARAGDACESCGSVAWSRQLFDALQLRDREGDPDRPHVLCAKCCEKFDAKQAKRRRVG